MMLDESEPLLRVPKCWRVAVGGVIVVKVGVVGIVAVACGDLRWGMLVRDLKSAWEGARELGIHLK
jgi:hypothetical protein